jgi:uptake hydrogenase large subunit
VPMLVILRFLQPRPQTIAMNLEGRIDILLTRRCDAPARVSIQSTRPQLAQKLLVGRTPEEAAHLAGLVFSLCGRAQRVAAQVACAAAQERMPNAVEQREHEIAVMLELAQEHAWRLLLNWPEQAGALLGIVPDMPSLLSLRQAAGDPRRFAETLDALLHTTLLGEPAADWMARDLAGFDAWRRSAKTPIARLFSTLGEGADLGVSQARLLPSLRRLEDAAARDLARRALDEPQFCAQPLWYDAPAETGALARLAGHALLAAWIAQRGRGAGARLLARLLELAALPARLGACLPDAGSALVRAWALGENSGIAGVETSRGLLFHVVRLRAGKVAEYRIVAPTEWNFHPDGPLLQALTSLAQGDDMVARARLVAQSLDPCVAFAIEFIDVR